MILAIFSGLGCSLASVRVKYERRFKCILKEKRVITNQDVKREERHRGIPHNGR